MLPLVLDPVAELTSLVSATPIGRRIAVGLAGVPGSGKSVMAAQLAARVNAALGVNNAVCVVGMDGFHLPKSALAQGVAGREPAECFARRGAPFTFDANSFVSSLREVLAGASAWPDFDHARGDPEPGAIIIPADTRMLIVEGIYVLLNEEPWCAVRSLLSRRWFLDTPRALADERLAKRHMSAWGIDEESAKARIALNDGPNGDIVVASSESADARVLPDPNGISLL
jgi:pantothenate kinase